MSLTPPPHALVLLWVSCSGTVQWQEQFCTVTPSPKLSTLTSMSITRTVRLQNLVAHRAAEGTPLRHVLLGWFTILSGREKGQAGGLGGAEAEEEVNTATLCIYLLHYFSQASLHGGSCCFIQGPSIFLPDCEVWRHPAVLHQRGRGGTVSSSLWPAVTLI